MRKEVAEKKGSSNRIFVFLLVLLLGVGGGILWLNGEVEAAQVQLEGAKDDYETMKRWQRLISKIRSEQKKGGNRKNVKPPENVGDILPYLSEKARQAGIPKGVRRTESHQTRQVGKGWTQYSWVIRVTGNKKNLLDLASIVKFLQSVETERPYLKTKDLTVDYEGQQVLKAYITISYLTKKK